MVALVAALAALAVAGRIAFAAFPNVKPTTDIVIFAGYALGGAPGFAVGALTALVSNFWFGQGAWTPWQMAAWGLCGVFGAALAIGGRNLGRVTLAAACGFAGVAYGALLNFSLMTNGGELSLRRFGAFELSAIPFDAAHAIGNIVFALIAGPAMIRMLIRFRERFEWDRAGRPVPPRSVPRGKNPALRAGGLAALMVVGLALGALTIGALEPDSASASGVGRAANWLQSVQNADGGFGASPGEESGPAMTGWAMLGLEAAGRNPLDIASHGHTPIDFLRSVLGDLKSPGDLSRTILALLGAGVNPRRFGGVNLVSRLLGTTRPNGSFGGWPTWTAFGVIALRAAGATGGLPPSLAWLRRVQNGDGGWGDVPGSPSTADDTGAVMQALSGDSKAAQRGLSYLRGAQRPGGGFPLGGNGAVNTQSTAWAIQGILATGADPGSFRRGGSSAPAYLAAQQASDGHYRYSNSSNQTPIWVTGEVLIAAAGDDFPVPAPRREPKPAHGKATASDSTSGTGPTDPEGVIQAGAPGASTSSGHGGGGPLPNVLGPPRHSTPGAPAATAPAEGREREVSGSPDSESLASEEPTDPTSKSGSAGAAVLGLLTGCLLFATALGVHRLWRRRRYGL